MTSGKEPKKQEEVDSQMEILRKKDGLLRGICGLAAVVVALTIAGATRAEAPATYVVDPVHSSVVFRVKHLGLSYFYGVFNEVEGKFVVDEANPGKSSVELKVAVGSVSTRDSKRDEHLKSPDFFDEKQFPSITFKSKSVRKLDGSNYEVSGDMTLHGVTKPLTVRVEQVGKGKGQRGEDRIGFHTVFTIKRSEYGMTYMVGDKGVSDEVQITVSVEGIRQ
jgi:polyisoprenoid-binding protein YceI